MAAPIDAARSVRWGILGAGAIAATVGRDIAGSDGNEVVAVGSRDAGRAATFADRHGIGRSYGSYAELVADPDIDVIYIATTHGQHHEHALLALRAGKPILVEKAFTLNARQAAEVVACARAADLFCMEAMWLRVNPLILRARELARSGRIGTVIGVRADLSKRFDYDPAHRLFDLAAGGGALLDLGVYPVNFAWLVLGRPDSVQATGSLAPTGTDVTVAMQWHYADGRFAQLQSSAAGNSPYAGLVTGTDGWIRINDRLHRPGSITIRSGDDEETILAGPGDNTYRAEIAEVARCLRAGLIESPAVPLDDTVDILELLDGVRGQLGVSYPTDEQE